MRKVLESKRFERVSVIDGAAADMMTVKDSWADVVVVAQVCHPFPVCVTGLSTLQSGSTLMGADFSVKL